MVMNYEVTTYSSPMMSPGMGMGYGGMGMGMGGMPMTPMSPMYRDPYMNNNLLAQEMAY
jgi:hypothetical protein